MNMDFLVRNDNSTELWYFSPQTKSKASGFRFIGEWQSHLTKASKPIIWAKDLFSFVNEIIKDFSIGERDVEINAKYRHLGWVSGGMKQNQPNKFVSRFYIVSS